MDGRPVINSDIDSALAEAHQRYSAARPKSRAAFDEACASMPGGNTRTTLYNAPFPTYMTRGEGCRLWDADGREYVDFLGDYTAGIYGHSHPTIRKAVDAALNSGVSFGAQNLNEAKLSALVCARFPAIDRVRFTNSGTEGNLMALTAARIFVQRADAKAGKAKRERVLVFKGGYHGGVFYFVSGHSAANAPFDFVFGDYNDVEGTRALIAKHAHEMFAVMLEPMQGSGGCIAASLEFLKMLREETKARGIVLCFDEVMTSRLAPGGLQEKTGVLPDMVALGKYIGGGMSFGAFGGKAEIMDMFDPRRADAVAHAGTFNNNTLTMAAGAAGFGEVYTPEAARVLNARGETLRERLNAVCLKANAPLQFTGVGSMMTAHAMREPVRSVADLAKSDQKIKELLFFDLLEAGVWTARRGFVALNVMIGDAECDTFVGAVDEFVQSRKALFAGA